LCYFFFIFFFQAEDGIRDFHVTGVQTCALPIFALTWLTTVMLRFAEGRGWISEHWVEIPIVALAAACFAAAQALGGSGFIACFRSEERRVGKECRCWGSAYDYKKQR